MYFIFVYKFVFLRTLYEIHLQHLTPVYFSNLIKHYNLMQKNQS